jgi:hypothetical protein
MFQLYTHLIMLHYLILVSISLLKLFLLQNQFILIIKLL